jgi:cytochrome subunit of sulfide dehydrogenase
VSLVLLGTQVAAAAAAAADADYGAQLAATCASCHGPAGGGQGIPSLAGRDEQTIISSMQAFRASEGPSHVMHAVALSLTEEELAIVAHYLATHVEEANSP